jgi:hypothetical protein
VTPEFAILVYDRLLSGWRAARRVGQGEFAVVCPFHDDHDPSLRVNEAKGTWYCDVCAEGGGAWDLAVRLGRDGEARAILRESEPERDWDERETPNREQAQPVEILGDPTSEQLDALRRSRRLLREETVRRAGAKRVRWAGDDWLGFPTFEGGWKLWALDSRGQPRLERGKLKRRNVGPVSLLVSPALLENATEPFPRLWDVEGESDFLAALDAGLSHVISR